MVLVAMFERARTRDRARVRPNAPGNFITDQRRATVFSLTLNPTPAHYIHWWNYVFPESRAIGYVDEPPLSPPWVAVGPSGVSNQVPDIIGGIIPGQPGAPSPPLEIIPFDPTPITPGEFQNTVPVSAEVAEPLAILPGLLPPGADLAVILAHRAGDTFRFIPGTAARQIQTTEFPVRHVTILADQANALPIWLGYTPGVEVSEGFKLIPGAAKDLNIDDLSDLWLIAENATDQVFVEFTQ